MTVIVAENTPDKVRGLLKRWFIEPKPNVFVGSVNCRIREKVLQYLLRYSPEDLAMLVIFDDVNSQGFRIRRYGDSSRSERLVSGHYLLALCEGEEETEDGLMFSNRGVPVSAELREVFEQSFVTYQPKG